MTHCRSGRKGISKFFAVVIAVFLFMGSAHANGGTISPLALQPGDVVPTGNEWIALPTIRASDGALENFNVLSMRSRGLLEVAGMNGEPVIQPYFTAWGKPLPFENPSWSLLEYWIPQARLRIQGLEASLTYCAPRGSRAAFLELTMTNRTASPVPVSLGVKASWGSLNRVTYTPVAMRGDRTISAAPFAEGFGQVFSFVTSDTRFAWALLYPGSQAQVMAPPVTIAPTVVTSRSVTLAPGATVEAHIVLGVGVEEYSASQSANALAESIDRKGPDGIINQEVEWLKPRTRTTGREDLDQIMNRNFLFTAMYAWGRTLDTDQFIGVTSRSPRYYVSAAYWDRDSMMWSFPGLLDVDVKMARQALEYALTVQLKNTGTHSRFIDGIVLEDGLELDELSAPILALSDYVERTGDVAFLAGHRNALDLLRGRIEESRDPSTGLYATLQNAEDLYVKQAFSTYDNVVTWSGFMHLASLYRQMHDSADADAVTAEAVALHKAILKYCVGSDAAGADGPIFVSATDGHSPVYGDVSPGSLLTLPALGFVPEKDPVFQRTYRWLHSNHYPYSYAGEPFGLPGDERLPFTSSWSVVNHLRLDAGRAQALKILLGASWDGGLISEGVSPETGKLGRGGRAFATESGYLAHTICLEFCTDNQGK